MKVFKVVFSIYLSFLVVSSSLYCSELNYKDEEDNRPKITEKHQTNVKEIKEDIAEVTEKPQIRVKEINVKKRQYLRSSGEKSPRHRNIISSGENSPRHKYLKSSREKLKSSSLNSSEEKSKSPRKVLNSSGEKSKSPKLGYLRSSGKVKKEADDNEGKDYFSFFIVPLQYAVHYASDVVHQVSDAMSLTNRGTPVNDSSSDTPTPRIFIEEFNPEKDAVKRTAPEEIIEKETRPEKFIVEELITKELTAQEFIDFFENLKDYATKTQVMQLMKTLDLPKESYRYGRQGIELMFELPYSHHSPLIINKGWECLRKRLASEPTVPGQIGEFNKTFKLHRKTLIQQNFRTYCRSIGERKVNLYSKGTLEQVFNLYYGDIKESEVKEDDKPNVLKAFELYKNALETDRKALKALLLKSSDPKKRKLELKSIKALQFMVDVPDIYCSACMESALKENGLSTTYK